MRKDILPSEILFSLGDTSLFPFLNFYISAPLLLSWVESTFFQVLQDNLVLSANKYVRVQKKKGMCVFGGGLLLLLPIPRFMQNLRKYN